MPRRPPRRSAPSVAHARLLGAACALALAAGACGSGDESAAPDVVPTAVPSIAPTEAPAPTATPEPTLSPSPTTPSADPTPEPTPTPPPTVAPTPSPDEGGSIGVISTPTPVAPSPVEPTSTPATTGPPPAPGELIDRLLGDADLPGWVVEPPGPYPGTVDESRSCGAWAEANSVYSLFDFTGSYFNPDLDGFLVQWIGPADDPATVDALIARLADTPSECAVIDDDPTAELTTEAFSLPATSADDIAAARVVFPAGDEVHIVARRGDVVTALVFYRIGGVPADDVIATTIDAMVDRLAG